MAGHSQFKNIMHRKGAQDRKRALLFSKLSREIAQAAKLGGEDPAANARLRLAIQTARSHSMPKDNIARAVRKGTGSDGDVDYIETRYEGYGPGGIAVIVDVMTDNRNRTAAAIRAIFNKGGGNLGQTGSVSFMFERVGMVQLATGRTGEEALFEAALEIGAEDVSNAGDCFEITCEGDNLGSMTQALTERFGAPESSDLIWRPKTPVAVSGEAAEDVMRLLDALDDHEDVQNVYANCDIAEDVMQNFADTKRS